MAEIVADPEIVQLANDLAKLPFWAEFDVEAAIAAYREKLFNELGKDVDVNGFKRLWVALGYDKVTTPAAAVPPAAEATESATEPAPAAEETGEAIPASEVPVEVAAPAPVAVEEQTTENYKACWDLISKSVPATKLPIQHILGTITLCKSGYSETTFRTILKAGDHAGVGAVKEDAVWTAISRCVNRSDALSGPTVRSHLRKAWRKAEKFAPPAPEGTGEGEGSEVSPPAPVIPPADSAALMDSLVEALQGDELLAEVLLKEVAIPIKAPEEPAAEEAAE